MAQSLNLLHLAPDIQEELLFLPRVKEGKAMVHEHMRGRSRRRQLVEAEGGVG